MFVFIQVFLLNVPLYKEVLKHLFFTGRIEGVWTFPVRAFNNDNNNNDDQKHIYPRDFFCLITIITIITTFFVLVLFYLRKITLKKTFDI